MGTRRAFTIRAAQKKDHPHAYGDKFIPSFEGENHEGSSPRVWGQDIDTRYSDMSERIIPTRMGTSSYMSPFHTVSMDHPHAYGDK